MSKNDRMYSTSDAEMLESAEVIAASLSDDIGDFTAFDSTMTPDYVTTVQGAVGRVKEIKPDAVIIDEMSEWTQKVDAAMKKCSNAYNNVAYFIRKAYNGNTAVQNQFGLNDYMKVRDSQAKMVLFMETLGDMGTAHHDELVAAGCGESVITSITEVATELREANINQEKYKKERGVLTQERVKRLNEVYQLLVPLSDAAQIIYRDDPARLSKYTLTSAKPAGGTDQSSDEL
ncbi:hypothetical protein PbJCM13498_27070 [Prolixibacter bellariivorans]|uniref:Uncharacterized protein n=1 Tax=Prolixibacter bellariivorans TaxID=314319 RepID=A0A5M4B197_9BACT|nr:hypothetical protein [Prolixibacter bellariivorans]GET33844.1 hypothetical protein PbJCM13498_27070 [Prolixibacter bellariivorans]